MLSAIIVGFSLVLQEDMQMAKNIVNILIENFILIPMLVFINVNNKKRKKTKY